MFKIAILGCENSHANSFLKFIQEGRYPDTEVIGVYSYDAAAAQKLHDTFGVPVMPAFDSLVGKVDGIVITARDGKYHYPYAKPYLASGIPMFIDKPITVSETDAVEFMREAKRNNVRLCGGSSCQFLAGVIELAEAVRNETYGRVMGASICCPINLKNDYSGFYFYTQHLIQVMTTILGYDVSSIVANIRDDKAAFIAKYADFDVTGSYSGEGWYYHVSLYGSKACKAIDMPFTGEEFNEEFKEFHDLLLGGEMRQSYDEFIRPVFLLNAIERSSNGGKWVDVTPEKV